MELKNIKGTFDYLPNEQIIRNKIISKLTKIFEEFGYLPLETSMLCYYDLLASKYAGGAEILKEMYTLTDQGERKIGLRYDLTVPFSKVISMNMNKEITLPFRRYEIGKVFRDGPVKVGRDREFYQCDIDLCGISGVYAEAELMSLAVKGYKELGIDIELDWNNRKLLSGLIKEVDIEESLTSRVILSVDKLLKIGETGVAKELDEENISESKLRKLFDLFKLSLEELKIKYENTSNQLLLEGINEVIELNNYLKELGLKECKFIPSLARGLEIYTGTVFEIFDAKRRITSSLGAGGRYDKIITNFINDGNVYPALGMTFGLVPIYEILKQNETKKERLYDCFIIPMDTNVECLKLANKLRDEGLKVLIEMNKRKVKKSFDWANKNNVRYVIALGETEVTTKKINVKDMDNSTNKEVAIDDIDTIVDIIKNK